MKIIVTGGAGFIGSSVCRYLIQETHSHVINIDKLTYAANLHSLDPVSDDSRYIFYQADICDSGAMQAIFAQHQPDRVINLAAESHVDRSITGAGEFIQSNIVGTFTLLDVAFNYWRDLPDAKKADFRFLQVSTDEVYGSLGPDGLFEETTPYDPSSPYSASKASADHLVTAWHRTYEFPALKSNCSNNYGPYQFPEKLIPLALINALHDRPIPVYGDGSNVRDWLYVEDHARALALILDAGKPGESYNVGGRNERTNLQVVHAICDLLDAAIPRGRSRRELIEFVTDRPGHDQRYAIDASKLEQELGWRALENYETGLEKTIGWYRDNQDWWEPLFRRGTYDQRLGLLDPPAS